MARISKEQLLRLQKRYATDAAIAELFNITRQAVQRMRMRYGILAQPPHTHERNREIATRYADGQSGNTIARALGISSVHVYRILRQELGPDAVRIRHKK